MKRLKVVGKGGNRKIGKGVATTYRPIGVTCPLDCPLLEKGCYAKRGFVAYSQKASLTDCHKLDRAKGTPLIRHHISGDVFINNTLDEGYVNTLLGWHRDNPTTMGWLYTHRIEGWDAAGFTSDKIPPNLVVVASVDNEQQRQYAVANGWKYARVEYDGSKPLEASEILCPFDKKKDTGKQIKDIKTTCKTCGLCFETKHTAKNIVFMYQK